jgi:hypothetical protein
MSLDKLTLLSDDARDAACRAVCELVDRGGGAGEIRLVDLSGKTLLVVPLDSPGFTAPRNGVALARGLPRSGRGLRDGDAVRFEVCDSAGRVAWSGKVAKPGGLGALMMRDTHISVGQLVSITEIQHKQG